MKDLNLTIDDWVLENAQAYALTKGTNVEGLMREFLRGLPVVDPAAEVARRAAAHERLLELMDKSTGSLGPDYVWNREEIYEDRMLPRHKHPSIRRGRKKA